MEMKQIIIMDPGIGTRQRGFGEGQDCLRADSLFQGMHYANEKPLSADPQDRYDNAIKCCASRFNMFEDEQPFNIERGA